MIPSFAAIIVLIWGLGASRTGVLRMQVLVLVFGGTAALMLPAIGGATVVIPDFALIFLVASAFFEARATGQGRSASLPSFILGFTVLWGVVLAVVIPRAFAGEFEITAISHSPNEPAFRRIGPVSGNITQSVYAIGNLAAFASARVLLRKRGRIQAFADAAVTLALINCGAAALNVFEFYTGIPSLLEFVRTAYVVHNQTFGSFPRINGTFPETSAFSGFSLGLFGFTAQLWLSRVDSWRTGLASILLVLCLLVSTSATAYAGLIGYVPFLAVSMVQRARRGWVLPRFAWVLVVVIAVLAVMGALIVLEAPVVDNLRLFLEQTLLDKMDSDSGLERGRWNSRALQNFLDTYGLGVGFGTVRTSSFVVTLLSNVGVIGTLGYCGFLCYVLKPKHQPSGEGEPPVIRAARHSTLALLVAAAISGTVFHMGTVFYMFAALASVEPSETDP